MIGGTTIEIGQGTGAAEETAEAAGTKGAAGIEAAETKGAVGAGTTTRAAGMITRAAETITRAAGTITKAARTITGAPGMTTGTTGMAGTRAAAPKAATAVGGGRGGASTEMTTGRLLTIGSL